MATHLFGLRLTQVRVPAAPSSMVRRMGTSPALPLLPLPLLPALSVLLVLLVLLRLARHGGTRGLSPTVLLQCIPRVSTEDLVWTGAHAEREEEERVMHERTLPDVESGSMLRYGPCFSTSRSSNGPVCRRLISQSLIQKAGERRLYSEEETRRDAWICSSPRFALQLTISGLPLPYYMAWLSGTFANAVRRTLLWRCSAQSRIATRVLPGETW